MFRFNTAFISNAAHRTFATSALLLRLQLQVFTEEVGDERQSNPCGHSSATNSEDGYNETVAPKEGTSIVASVGHIHSRGPANHDASQKIRATDVDAPVENKQSKDCLAELEAALEVKNGEAVAVDLRALRNELVAHRAENAQLQKRFQKLEAEVDLFESVAYDKASVDLIAEALELVDSEFQRRFNTPFSLVTLWFTPERVCPNAAKIALKGFLDENEIRLPRPLRMHFFSAWESIRVRRNSCPNLCTDARTLERHEVEDALVMCCEEWGEELRAILLEVIMSYVERKSD